VKQYKIQATEFASHRDLRCGLGLIHFQKVVNELVSDKFPSIQLGKVLSLEYGKSLTEEERTNKGFPVVGSNGIIGYHQEYLVEGPCIIIGRKGSAGEITYVENNCYPIDTTFYVNLQSDELQLKFLYYLLEFLRLQRLALFKGVPGLNRYDAYEARIPLLPKSLQNEAIQQIIPIEEQLNALTKQLKNPVEVINKVFAENFGLNTVTFEEHEKQKILIKNSNDFGGNHSLRFSFHYQKYSSFDEQFSDKKVWQDLTKVFKVSGGKRIPKGGNFSSEQTDYFYLRPNEVDFGNIKREELPCLLKTTYQKLKRYKISSGDLAISIVGTLGKIAFVNLDLLEINNNNLILSENFAKISPKRKIDADFFFYFFHSYLFLLQVEKEYTIRTQKKLGLDKIGNLKIPNISSDHQNKIAKEIQTELQHQDEIKQEIEKKQEDIESIIRSII